MKPECRAEISHAVGRDITDAEASYFETALQRHGRLLARENPGEWAKLTLIQRVGRAAQAAHLEATGKAEKAAQRKAANVVAQARERRTLTNRAPMMRGTHPHHSAVFERMRQSENYIAGIRHESMASIMDAIEATSPQFLRLLEDPIAIRDFAREVYGQDTGNPIAKAAAESYLPAMETLRLRENAAGADIGKLSYGWLPQPHDVGKVARADKRAWREFVKPLVNRNRYVNDDGTRMNEEQFDRKLEAIYDAIATEGRNTRVPGKSGGQMALAERKDDQHRQLNFKGADTHLAYLREYGRGGMMEAIAGHVGLAAKRIGLMESFGPNPGATFRLLKDTAEKLDNAEGVRESLASLDMVWDTLTGSAAQPVNASLATRYQNVRNYVVAAKLQGVMLSSVTDAPLQMLAAGANGMPLGKTLVNTLKSFGGDTIAAAARLGLATEYSAGEMAAWHADNLAQGWTRKLANTTMRLTGVEAWTHALRRGFGLTLSGTLGDMVKAGWHELDAVDRGRFTAAGVTERDWKIWQKAELTDVGGQMLLTHFGIRAVEGESLEHINRATAKLLGFIDQEAHMAVLSPDIMTRALITQGTRAGTHGGELGRCVMLFKSFPMAILVKHLRRWQSLPWKGGRGLVNNRIGYSVAMMSGLTTFGALALQLKALAAGADPRDMSDKNFWGSAFVQGGGVGIFSDLLYTTMQGNTRGGTAYWSTLAGPVLGTGLEGVSVGQGGIKAAITGKNKKGEADLVRFAKANTPLVNLWYARTAIDHLFVHELQESINPGYLRRMRKRAHDEFDQDYWWRPGDTLPKRAPDLEAAVGE